MSRENGNLRVGDKKIVTVLRRYCNRQKSFCMDIVDISAFCIFEYCRVPIDIPLNIRYNCTVN